MTRMALHRRTRPTIRGKSPARQSGCRPSLGTLHERRVRPPAPDTGEWKVARVHALRALREEMKGKEPTLGQAWRRLKQLGLGRGPGRPPQHAYSLWEELFRWSLPDEEREAREAAEAEERRRLHPDWYKRRYAGRSKGRQK